MNTNTMTAGMTQPAAVHPPVQEYVDSPAPPHVTARHLIHRQHLSDTSDQPATAKSEIQYSEHGNGLDSIELLTKHKGSSVNNFFNGLFTTVIAISTLSTSITFSFILSNQTVPPPELSRFSADQVQLFLAISWLCSLLCLASAALASTLLTFYRKHWVKDWDGENGKTSQLTVQLYAVSASAIMGSLLTASFIFMCLVVVAYQAVIGWISLGFTSFFGLVIVVAICNQIPWCRNRITSRSEKASMA